MINNEYWYEYEIDKNYLDNLQIEYDDVYSKETYQKVIEVINE